MGIEFGVVVAHKCGMKYAVIIPRLWSGSRLLYNRAYPKTAEHSLVDTNSTVVKFLFGGQFYLVGQYVCIEPYVFPVKWFGNEKNPRLVILLCNPGGDPKWPKRLPEYAMQKDGVYKDAGISLADCQKYNDWWDDFFDVFEKHKLNPADVLLLEFYPYHTVSSRDFSHNPEKWNDYARAALDSNIEILRRYIAQGLPIFGYYWGDWLRTVPELQDYDIFHKSEGTWKKQKIKELDEFLTRGLD